MFINFHRLMFQWPRENSNLEANSLHVCKGFSITFICCQGSSGTVENLSSQCQQNKQYVGFEKFIIHVLVLLEINKRSDRRELIPTCKLK